MIMSISNIVLVFRYLIILCFIEFIFFEVLVFFDALKIDSVHSLFVVPFAISSNCDNGSKKSEVGAGVGVRIVNLHPYYIVGLCDGEATFTISISKDNRERKTIRRLPQNVKRDIFSVHPSFAISLNIKDKNLVYSLQSYFGVGKIKQDLSHNAITFYVNSVKELTTVILPFFNKYQLITQKQADFLLFKSAIKLIKEGEHLKPQGLAKIVSIKASMNKGLSDKLGAYFSSITVVDRPEILDQKIKDAQWLAGFTEGEGSFYIRIKDAKTKRSINRISFFFSIVQSTRDSQLIFKLSKYLNCGTVSTSAMKKYIQYRVTKFEDIKFKIIPFFKKYRMQGIKRFNFEDFCQVMELVQSNAHLTSEGLDKIKCIKKNMNLGRV